MSDTIVATIPKNAREEIRVILNEFNGHKLLNIRIFVNVDDRPDRRPTAKGLTIKRHLLPALMEALAKAQAAIEATGE